MKKWKYHTESLYMYDNDSLDTDDWLKMDEQRIDLFNRLGDDGWELVTIYDGTSVKRRKRGDKAKENYAVFKKEKDK